MRVRKAIPEDCKEAVELIYEANLKLASHFVGEEDRDKIIEGIEDFFLSRGSFLSHEQCLILETEGGIAGCLIAFGHDDSEGLDVPVVKNLMKKYKPGSEGYRRYIESQKDVAESSPGEYYIDTIAVKRRYRGLGYGRILMDHAESLAGKAGYRVVSLLCSYSNEKAYRFYRELGYTEDRDVKIDELLYRHMVKSV